MNITFYKIGFWASLLAPNAHTYQLLVWKDDRLQLKGRKGGLEIPYEKILDQLGCFRGVFWSQLVITIEGQNQLLIGGIPNSQIKQLRDSSNKTILEYFSSQLGTMGPAIVECAQAWCDLTNYQHYFRHSQLISWHTKAKSLRRYVTQIYRANHQNIEMNNAAGTIDSVLDDPDAQRRAYNERFTLQQLEKYKYYFDRVESKPLSGPQRQACVQHEDSNLVLAGAGTGKTSTMVGKAGYLIESGEAHPDEILMLAFGNKAAKEMEGRVKERLGIASLKIKTFHSLGLEIIGMAEGKKPALCDLAEDTTKFGNFIARTIAELKQESSYRSTFIEYFLYHLCPSRSMFDFKTFEEYIRYCNENEPRTLNGELVKSYEELTIANYLFQMGVNYNYEMPYKIDTATTHYRRYNPDFYLPDYDIYLEHFALNKNGAPPNFMDQHKYIEGVKWKRELHQQQGTKLLETFSHEQKDGVLLENLKQKLKDQGVTFNPVPHDKLLDKINSLQEAKDFSKLLADLLKAFKLAGWKMAELLEKAKRHIEDAGVSLIIKLFQPLYERYQAYLEASRTIDFEDMINRAVAYVDSGAFRSPYRFVLVDEFQDISEPRANLIKGLVRQNSQNSLFCVGDDWQAIYRFTGSDVLFTKHFADHFGTTAINKLDTTYRFNNRIGDVASRFVQENPDQIKKKINSQRQVYQAAVSLVPATNDNAGLRTALERISRQAESGATVLLLARFNFREPRNLNQLKQQFPALALQFMSVHASKGKEADYVIVIGMEKGKHGFPSEKATHPLLEMLLPPLEKYSFAEERRLFYVALTRARHHVYLISHPHKSSIFIRELRKYGQDVELLNSEEPGIPSWTNDIACPACHVGYLVPRMGRFGPFFVCSNQPYCEHKVNACAKCGGNMQRQGNLLVCQTPNCGERLALCPRCNGILKERGGSKGRFWGCSNYRSDEPSSCRYTTNVPPI